MPGIGDVALRCFRLAAGAVLLSAMVVEFALDYANMSRIERAQILDDLLHAIDEVSDV